MDRSDHVKCEGFVWEMVPKARLRTAAGAEKTPIAESELTVKIEVFCEVVSSDLHGKLSKGHKETTIADTSEHGLESGTPTDQHVISRHHSIAVIHMHTSIPDSLLGMYSKEILLLT